MRASFVAITDVQNPFLKLVWDELDKARPERGHSHLETSLLISPRVRDCVATVYAV